MQMNLSSRNQISGKVVSISKGSVMANVKIDIGNGNILTSAITADAANDLALKQGDAVIAIIKSTSIMIGK
jgi:molybdopterin-binding protein